MEEFGKYPVSNYCPIIMLKTFLRSTIELIYCTLIQATDYAPYSNSEFKLQLARNNSNNLFHYGIIMIAHFMPSLLLKDPHG